MDSIPSGSGIIADIVVPEASFEKAEVVVSDGTAKAVVFVIDSVCAGSIKTVD